MTQHTSEERPVSSFNFELRPANQEGTSRPMTGMATVREVPRHRFTHAGKLVEWLQARKQVAKATGEPTGVGYHAAGREDLDQVEPSPADKPEPTAAPGRESGDARLDIADMTPQQLADAVEESLRDMSPDLSDEEDHFIGMVYVHYFDYVVRRIRESRVPKEQMPSLRASMQRIMEISVRQGIGLEPLSDLEYKELTALKQSEIVPKMRDLAQAAVDAERNGNLNEVRDRILEYQGLAAIYFLVQSGEPELDQEVIETLRAMVDTVLDYGLSLLKPKDTTEAQVATEAEQSPPEVFLFED